MSELVVVRNLPYLLAEISFLSLDSACRSPVATVYFVPFVFFPYVGSTYLAPLVPRCHFQEQSCLNTFVLFISLWLFQLFFSARRPVAYDRVFPMRFYLVLVLASFGEDITWHRFWVPWNVQVRGRSSCGRSPAFAGMKAA